MSNACGKMSPQDAISRENEKEVSGSDTSVTQDTKYSGDSLQSRVSGDVIGEDELCTGINQLNLNESRKDPQCTDGPLDLSMPGRQRGDEPGIQPVDHHPIRSNVRREETPGSLCDNSRVPPPPGVALGYIETTSNRASAPDQAGAYHLTAFLQSLPTPSISESTTREAVASDLPSYTLVATDGRNKQKSTQVKTAAQSVRSSRTRNRMGQTAHTKEATYKDDRFQSICESSQHLINQMVPEKFVSTYAARSALTLLRQFGSLFIEGRSGSGKSSLGLRLLLEMENLENRIPIVLTSPEQWHLIPKTLGKNENKTVAQGKSVHEKRLPKYTVMIDDIFGASNLVQSQVDDWTRMFDIMWPWVESGEIFLMLTSRTEIRFQCQHRIKPFTLIEKCHSVMLDQGRYSLRQGEKKRIMRMMCGNKGSLTDIEINEIAGLETALGFPQCCKFFTGSRQAQSKGMKFFLTPREYILEEVNKMHENDCLGYLVLLLVLMRRGCLEISQLDPRSCSDEFRKMTETLRDLCVNLPSTPTLTDIRHKADSLCGFYLCLGQNGYVFHHQSIFDSVFISISRKFPDICLAECPVHIIMELIRTQNSPSKQFDDVSVILDPKYYVALAKRVMHLMMSEDNYACIGYTSDCSIVQWMNRQRKRSSIADHPSLGDKEFVDCLVELLIKEEDLSMILQTKYSKSVNTKVVILFAIENVLTHMIYKNNIIFVTKLVRQCFHTLDNESKAMMAANCLPSAIYTGKSDLIQIFLDMGALPDETCFRALCVSSNVKQDLTYRLLCLIFKTGDSSLDEAVLNWSTFRDLKDLFCLAVIEGNTHLVKWLTDRLKCNTDSIIIFSDSLTYLYLKISKRNKDLYFGNRYGVLFGSKAHCSGSHYSFHDMTEENVGRGTRKSSRFLHNRTCHLPNSGFIQISAHRSYNMKSVGEITKILLNTGCDIDTHYLLFLAAGHPDATSLKIILKVDTKVPRFGPHLDKDCSLLEQAVEHGGKECLEELLRWVKCDVNICDKSAERDDLQKILQPKQGFKHSKNYEDLVKDLDDTNRNIVQSLLHKAAATGNVQSSDVLLQAGFPVNFQDKDGNTPLHDAVKHNSFECAEILLNNHASVNIKNLEMETPIMLVNKTQTTSMDMIKLLVNAGSDINQPNVYGITLLYMAADLCNLDLVAQLCRRGADTNYAIRPQNSLRLWYGSSSPIWTETALHVACRKADFDVVKFLCERTEKLTFQDNKGKSLVHKSAGSLADTVEKLQYLLHERQLPVDTEDNDGRTALFDAIESNNEEVFYFLLKNGFDINHQDICGKSVLFYILVNCREGLVSPNTTGIFKLLLEWGANPCVYDKDGMTALHIGARDWSYFENAKGEIQINMFQLLLEKTASVCIKDKDGNTPLHLAVQYYRRPKSHLMFYKETEGDIETQTAITQILLEKGAKLTDRNRNGSTPLHLALQKRNMDIVKLLIEKGANPCTEDKDGQTPLHIAVGKRSTDMIKLLLEKGADPSCKNKNGCTPLHLAVWYGSTDITKLLLERDANLSTETNNGHTALHIAVRGSNLDIAKMLLEKGVDPCSQDNNGNTPLCLAVRDKNIDIAKLLLENGATLRTKTKDGHSPLHIAINSGDLNITKLLLEKGGDPCSEDKEGHTPLHLAVRIRNLAIDKLLLEEDADPCNKNIHGQTSLHLAIERGDLDITELLLKNGADPLSKNKDGYTPLHLAVRNRNIDFAKLLLETDTDETTEAKDANTLQLSVERRTGTTVKQLLQERVDSRSEDNNGYNPLLLAVENRDLDISSMLLERGADACTVDKDGNTPLHLAVGSRNIDITKLLLEKGANPCAENKDRQTPLHFAVMHRRRDRTGRRLLLRKSVQVTILKLLIQMGANLCATDKNGKTPLHLAEEIGNIHVVKLLHERDAVLKR